MQHEFTDVHHHSGKQTTQDHTPNVDLAHCCLLNLSCFHRVPLHKHLRDLRPGADHANIANHADAGLAAAVFSASVIS